MFTQAYPVPATQMSSKTMSTLFTQTHQVCTAPHTSIIFPCAKFLDARLIQKENLSMSPLDKHFYKNRFFQEPKKWMKTTQGSSIIVHLLQKEGVFLTFVHSPTHLTFIAQLFHKTSFALCNLFDSTSFLSCRKFYII